MCCITNIILWIVLILAIIALIYLFWRKNNEKSFIYQQFPVIAIPTHNGTSNMATILVIMELIANEFNQQSNSIIQKLRQYQNTQISPQTKRQISSSLNTFISKVNESFGNINTSVEKINMANIDNKLMTKYEQIAAFVNKSVRNFNDTITNFTDNRVVPIGMTTMNSFYTPNMY